MTTTSSLSRLPLAPRAGAPPTRGARSSAGSPSCAVAVGLAIDVPTQRDDRRRLPDRRVRPRRRHGRRGRLRRPGHRERPDHARERRTPRRGQAEAAAAAAARSGRMTASPASTSVAEPQLNPDGRRCSSRSSWPATRTTSRRCRTSRRTSQADHPELEVREAGDVCLDAAINDRVGRGPVRRPRAQPADHPDADAAGLRRPDRRRHPGAARAAPAWPPRSASRRRCRT